MIRNWLARRRMDRNDRWRLQRGWRISVPTDDAPFGHWVPPR